MDGELVGPGLERLAVRYRLEAPVMERLALMLSVLCDDDRAPTTVRDPLLALDTHLADSLVALEVERITTAGRIADLGSGPGLPGLVLAVALPGTQLWLVESQASKCAFIAALAAKLELTNVRVVWARAEEWAQGLDSNDVVVTRALAPQAVVLEYAAPLLRIGGLLVEWRGKRQPEDERPVAAAAEELGLRPLEVLEVEPFEGSRDRHLHLFEKAAATPERFPRRVGMARKRPLGA